MNISLRTVMEIYNHPYDLQISIEREERGTKHTFNIFRGPEAGYRLLLTTRPFAEKMGDAIVAVDALLRVICRKGSEVFGINVIENGDITIACQQPQPLEIEVLHEKFIKLIIEQLRKESLVNTWVFRPRETGICADSHFERVESLEDEVN